MPKKGHRFTGGKTLFHVRRFNPDSDEELRLLYAFQRGWEPLLSRLRCASTSEERIRIEKEMVLRLKEGLEKEVDPAGLFVAETCGRIIGFSRFYKGYHELDGKNGTTIYVSSQRIGWLGGIAVSPAYQRMGVGSAMLQTGLAYLRKQGVQKTRIMTNIPSFYEKHKFELKAKLHNVGREILLMERSL